MPLRATLVFIVAGVCVLAATLSLIGGFGQWSVLLGAGLLPVGLSLRMPAARPLARGICAATAALCSVFIVMSLVGSTIGSGMSPEFRPLFAGMLVLAVSGFYIARTANGNKVSTDDVSPENRQDE